MTQQLIERGKHVAIARHLQLGLSSNNNEQVVVGFELTNPDDPDCGRFITAFLFLTDKTFDRTIESLRYIGWEGDDLSELPTLLDNGRQPQEVELVVDHEDYDNKIQAKVKWVNRVGGGGAIKLEKPLEGDALKQFGARMKGRVRAAGDSPRAAQRSLPKSTTPTTTPNPTHPNAPGNGWNDDIPF